MLKDYMIVLRIKSFYKKFGRHFVPILTIVEHLSKFKSYFDAIKRKKDLKRSFLNRNKNWFNFLLNTMENDLKREIRALYGIFLNLG